MTADDQHLVEQWLQVGADTDAALSEELSSALADATRRDHIRHLLRERGLLHLAAQRPRTDDADAFSASVLQRIDLDREAQPFAAQWRRRHGRSLALPLRAWALAALVLIGIAWAATAWWPSAPQPSVVLVDGAEQVLEPGLVVSAADTARHIRWASRGLECELAPGGRLRWSGGPDDHVLHLEQGAATCRLTRQAGARALIMRLPDLELQVEGTRWRCQANERGSLVAVENGRIAVQVGDEIRSRGADEIVVAPRAGSPTWSRGDISHARQILADSAPEPAGQQPPRPELHLLDNHAKADSRQTVLALDAENLDPMHTVLFHQEKEYLLGEGLPNPWSSHNWEPDGRSELFTETIAGDPALVLRNVRGHGILLGQWRPVDLEPGTSCLIDIVYRCRGNGRLAVATAFGDSRSESSFQLPRVRDTWHRALVRCDLPPGDAPKPFALLLFNQTPGNEHDVVLRSVTVSLLQ